MKTSHIVLIAIVITSQLLTISKCELYTALVHLEKLLKTERKLITSLEEYLLSEENRLTQLKQLTQHYLTQHSLAVNAKDGQETYLANPINAYLLVKRLTADWKNVEYLVTNQRDNQWLENLEKNETFPSQEDLSGAAEALLRLQDTYKLSVSNIADGVIPVRDQREDWYKIESSMPSRSQLSPPLHRVSLTANDCFELGRQAYVNKDFYHTVLWMQEALDRLEKETFKTVEKVEILEYLAFSTYHQGNIRHALKLTHQLLQLAPDHPRAFGNIEYYEKEIKINEVPKKKKGDDGDVPLDDTINESDKTWTIEEDEREMYEALCRGEKRLSVQLESQLKCFHLDTSSIPFLRLMNIKIEETFKKPQIIMIHNIISDQEIEVIKTLAEPKLKRATVQNSKTGILEVAKYRISKSAWLTNNAHQVVQRITNRIQAITGLELSTAEELQVVNYGLGGQYEPHYDFARREEKDAFKSLGTGNRIATWMNYMSDVDAGGATVFPMLGVTIWPKRGSAAFWYNLHRSGDGDLLTRHAGCPVLAGSKWVSNKWIHERGQEFRKKCGRKINEYNLVQEI